MGFSESSPLYERLVIEEQSVDLLWASNADHVDPYLFTVMARVKEKEVELLLYKDEGHSFLDVKNVIDAEVKRVEFLAKVLERDNGR